MEQPLSCMVLQPNSVKATNQNDKQTYTETWKGPWSEIKKISDLKTSTIFGVKLFPGILRPTALDTDTTSWKKEFSTTTPSLPDESLKWVVRNVVATQLEAGDLGLLEIEYDTAREDSGGGGGGPQPGWTQTQPDTWTLSWGSYNRSVLEYATDVTDGTAVDIMNCKKNAHPTLAECHAAGMTQMTDADLKYAYWYGVPGGKNRTIKTLVDSNTPPPRTIFDYYAADVSPQFHYPMVQRHTTYKEDAQLSALSADVRNRKMPKLSVETSIDKKVTLPNDCPYALSGWQWLCTEDTCQCQFLDGRFNVTRSTTWTGAKKVDDNFYGDNAWTPWEPPVPNGGN